VRRPRRWPARRRRAGAAPEAAAGGAEIDGGQRCARRNSCAGLTYFCCCANHSGPIFHTVSYAIACGLPALAAVTIYSVEGLAGLGGRLLFGLSGDRFGAKQTLVVGLLIQAVAAGAYFFTRSSASSTPWRSSSGCLRRVMPLLRRDRARVFPAAHHGHGDRASSLVASLGMALGPAVGAGSTTPPAATAGSISVVRIGLARWRSPSPSAFPCGARWRNRPSSRPAVHRRSVRSGVNHLECQLNPQGRCPHAGRTSTRAAERTVFLHHAMAASHDRERVAACLSE